MSPNEIVADIDAIIDLALLLRTPRKLRRMSKRRQKIATKRRAAANILKNLRPLVGRVIDAKLLDDVLHITWQAIAPVEHITINCVILEHGNAGGAA